MNEELRALAEKATPGPWEPRHQGLTDGYPNVIVNAAESGYPGAILWGVRAEKDAAFIAAANPTAILALLDERDELKRQLDLCEGRPF